MIHFTHFCAFEVVLAMLQYALCMVVFVLCHVVMVGMFIVCLYFQLLAA